MKAKTRDLMVVGGWALGTMVVMVAMLLPSRLTAVDQPAGPAAAIARPTLTVSGVELSLVTAGDQPLAKSYPDMPAVEVLARNTQDRSVAVDVTTSMGVQNGAPPDSRVLMIEKQLWAQTHSITLAAGESKRIALALSAPPQPAVQAQAAPIQAKSSVKRLKLPDVIVLRLKAGEKKNIVAGSFVIAAAIAHGQ